MALVTDSRATRPSRWRRLRRGMAAAVTATALSTLGAVAPAAAGPAETSVELVYVANYTDNAVTAYDPATRTVVATVPVTGPLGRVTLSPDGRQVYVTARNAVAVINTATNTVIGTIPAGRATHSVTFSPDGTRAYVDHTDGVDVVDTATRTVTATIPMPGLPRTIGLTPDGRRAYVANNNDITVSVIDTATNTVTAIAQAGFRSPLWGAIRPDGAFAYVADSSNNNVSVIDTATNTVVTRVKVGKAPWTVAITPDGQLAYVNNYQGDSVSVIDTASNTVIATLPVGRRPAALAIDPAGDKVYVTNTNSNTMSVIDTATNTVAETVPTGRFPYGAAVGNIVPLTVTGISPGHGPATGGTTVTLTGHRLTGTTDVTFDGVPATDVTVVDDSTVTATVPPHAPGTVDVTLTAVGRTFPAKQYTYDIPAPAVSGVAPDHGPLAGGTTVTITGTNLTGATAVNFGAVAATAFTVDSDTQITATVPAASAAGPVDVTVTTPGGTSAPGKFTYDAPAPAVSGIAPDHGPLAGGTVVTITGTNLTGATAVNFGTTAATAFTVDSDTQITATVPAASAAGAVDVTVTTPGGTSVAAQYTYEEGSFVFAKSADPKSGSTVKAGDKVTYTVTVTQQGAGEVKGAAIADDLSKVLDDATYNGDVKATSGTAEVKDGKLTWTGDLPVGGTATITYSVTVTGKGDAKLHNAVTTTDTKRGTCATEKGCETDHTATAGSTATPTPTPTATATPTPTGTATATPTGTPTPGTPTPGPSAQGPVIPQGPSAPQQGPLAPMTPVTPVAPRASGILASTGATVLTTATVSGALLLFGGLAVALSRRRSRQG
ncbi:IPT/TIG domain-containing protein [Kitasatospora sp. NPDC008115]|uniref:IPT/TIG domain-containing protein n=1 Tax=Kitasatospora sp. NPDC008115 TaxID=3364022 RepID=UPI0036EAD480